MTGCLHLVATPIGNLGDIGPRAADVLRTADLICCEDTRRTGRLLQHLGGHTGRLAVCNDHTEISRIGEVLAVLDDGGQVALVSDAGTPGISDPGHRLTRAVIAAGHRVSPIPGPSAAVAALVASGLPTDRFVYEGFLPRRGGERTERLGAIAAETRTTVIYEAPHRVQRTLADLLEVCGPDRRVVLARELTKLHEEIVHGALGSVTVDEPRGEYVLVLEGAPDAAPPDDDDVRRALLAELDTGASTRDAAQTVAQRLGVTRREAYALAVGLRHAETTPTTGGQR